MFIARVVNCNRSFKSREANSEVRRAGSTQAYRNERRSAFKCVHFSSCTEICHFLENMSGSNENKFIMTKRDNSSE